MVVKKNICMSDWWNSDQENRKSIAEFYDVVLHIGAPKAGSSALQAFCINNCDALSEAGFYYPKHSLDKNNVSGGHSRLGMSLINKDLDTAKKIIDEWIDESKRNRNCLLISAESLYGTSKELKIILSNYKVLIIAYFRDPISSIISNYNQVVKRHFETSMLESYVKRNINQGSLGVSGKIYDSWADDFDSKNLVVCPYEKSAFPQGKIELSFLNMLGVPESMVSRFIIESRIVNASYSLPALELKRLLNQVLSQDDPSLSYRIDWCLQGYSDANSQCSSSSYEQLSDELYTLLINKFEPSNKYVKDNVLIGCPEGFLEYGEVKRISEPMVGINKLIKEVLDEAFVDDDGLIDILRELTINCVSSTRPGDFSLCKLAALLDIPEDRFAFRDVNFKEVVFDSKQMNVLLSDKSSEADLLREIAVMLERCGQLEQALKVICRAECLRPKGRNIVAIRKRINKCLDMD